MEDVGVAGFVDLASVGIEGKGEGFLDVGKAAPAGVVREDGGALEREVDEAAVGDAPTAVAISPAGTPFGPWRTSNRKMSSR